MSVLTSPQRNSRLLLADQPAADAQMAMDVTLAQEARPTFRLFRWLRPAVSIGFKQQPPRWVDPGVLAGHGIEVVERPTGGGVAVHGSDLSFSVVAPHDSGRPLKALLEDVSNTVMDAMSQFGIEVRWIADSGELRASTSVRQPRAGGVRAAAAPGPARTESASSSRITYCLTQQSPYAFMVGGRKLCGLAVRRYPASWLIQGSLLVRALPAVFSEVMPSDVLSSFRERAVSLDEAAGRRISDQDLTAAMADAWRTSVGE